MTDSNSEKKVLSLSDVPTWLILLIVGAPALTGGIGGTIGSKDATADLSSRLSALRDDAAMRERRLHEIEISVSKLDERLALYTQQMLTIIPAVQDIRRSLVTDAFRRDTSEH